MGNTMLSMSRGGRSQIWRMNGAGQEDVAEEETESSFSESPEGSLINQGLGFLLIPTAVTDKTLKGQGLSIINVNFLFT